jgi:hypothetical protein
MKTTKILVTASNRANRVLGKVKAEYGLKNKSEAVNLMAEIFEDEIMNVEINPKYLKKLEEISKEGTIDVGTVDDLRKRYG